MWISWWLLALTAFVPESTRPPAETVVVLLHTDWNEAESTTERLLRGFSLAPEPPVDAPADGQEASDRVASPKRDAYRQFTQQELDTLIGDGAGDPHIRIGIKRAAEAFCQQALSLGGVDFPVFRGVEGLLVSSGTLPAEREEKLWVLVFEPRFRVVERGRRQLESHLTVRLFRVQRSLAEGRWRLQRAELVFEDRSLAEPAPMPEPTASAEEIWSRVESLISAAAKPIERSFLSSGWSRLQADRRPIEAAEPAR